MYNVFQTERTPVTTTDRSQTIQEYMDILRTRQVLSPEEQRVVFKVIEETHDDQVKLEILESLQKSLESLHKSQEIGTQTLTILHAQGEQLNGVEHKVQHIENNMKFSKKLLQNIKSFWSSFFFKVTKITNAPPAQSALNNATSANNACATGAQANSVQTPTHAGPTQHRDARNFDREFDKQLDSMSSMLTDLREIGQNMNVELGRQNALVTNMSKRAEQTLGDIDNVNKNISKLL